MTEPVTLADRLPALAASSTRLEAALAAGGLEPVAVADATAIRMVAAGTLSPAPCDPLEHLRAAHAMARGHLTRLAGHDPAVEVCSTMTTTLFARLTRKPTDLPAPPTPARHYTYTPRKILRRVLDHALDHLNQIDQWLTWQHDRRLSDLPPITEHPNPTLRTQRVVAHSERGLCPRNPQGEAARSAPTGARRASEGGRSPPPS